jgi:hypothetical protein
VVPFWQVTEMETTKKSFLILLFLSFSALFNISYFVFIPSSCIFSVYILFLFCVFRQLLFSFFLHLPSLLLFYLLLVHLLPRHIFTLILFFLPISPSSSSCVLIRNTVRSRSERYRKYSWNQGLAPIFTIFPLRQEVEISSCKFVLCYKGAQPRIIIQFMFLYSVRATWGSV